MEIVKKSGAWFTYEGEQLGQGKENARAFLKEHADVAHEIERKVREAVGLTSFDEDAERPVEIPEAIVDELRSLIQAARRGAGQLRGRGWSAPSGLSRRRRRQAGRGRPRGSAKDRALGLLAVRWRSRRELEMRLRAAGFEETAVTAALDDLERAGLIDDERFARELALAKSNRMDGSRSVRSALAKAGVAPGLAEEVVDDLGDDRERAVALAASRVSRMTGLEPEAAYRRLYGFLLAARARPRRRPRRLPPGAGGPSRRGVLRALSAPQRWPIRPTGGRPGSWVLQGPSAPRTLVRQADPIRSHSLADVNMETSDHRPPDGDPARSDPGFDDGVDQTSV